jgi:hypothetical protein
MLKLMTRPPVSACAESPLTGFDGSLAPSACSTSGCCS